MLGSTKLPLLGVAFGASALGLATMNTQGSASQPEFVSVYSCSVTYYQSDEPLFAANVLKSTVDDTYRLVMNSRQANLAYAWPTEYAPYLREIAQLQCDYYGAMNGASSYRMISVHKPQNI